VLDRHPDIGRILYIDADFAFFSSADSVLDEWGDGSVYLVGHRYPESLRDLERHGKFNVGILGFRNDAEGRRCLEDWRRRCNAWCYDRIEDGKYADQKYLDAWPNSFRGVVVSQHPGVNVAPWNRTLYRLGERDEVPYVDGHPLVCYHFHGLKLYRFGLVEPQPAHFGGKLDTDWIRLVYAPYLRQVSRAETHVGPGQKDDLRHRRRLSWTDLTIVGKKSQFLIFAGGRWREVPPSLLESLRLARRGASMLRNLARWLISRSTALGET
jgi:hypothetical protein